MLTLTSDDIGLAGPETKLSLIFSGFAAHPGPTRERTFPGLCRNITADSIIVLEHSPI